MTALPEPAYLIVNADDYGYFRCTSKGILECATQGIVTATGIFATAQHFAEQIDWLRQCESVDKGVHLNLTTGLPLTERMRKDLGRWSGRFPPKFSMAAAIMSGTTKAEHVRDEWRAQIERCLEHGLKLQFLNSHEHIHMLPSLFGVTVALAGQYGIPHLRFPRSRIISSIRNGSVMRCAIVKTLETVNSLRHKRVAPRFLGLEASGKLGLDDFRYAVSNLRPGGVYELMCHPGRFDRDEIGSSPLPHYHHWEKELQTLTSPEAKEIIRDAGIRLIGYRDLQLGEGQLGARQHAL